MVFVVGGVLVLRAEAGVCARRRSNFLLSRQEKVTKEKATLLCVSLRCATGNLRCSDRGCAAELTARYALRSNNCGKSVHEVRVSFGTRTPPLPCASRHAQKGTQEADIHTGHCFAALRSAPTRGRKRHAQRRPSRAQRWPEWTSPPSGRAEKRRAWGGRSEACASCSDSLPLFERRERSEQSEFGSAAPRPSIAGCPEGDAASGAHFFCLLFLCEQEN